MMYAGSDWIEGTLKKELSPLGGSVADLLGQWHRGIYHINTNLLNKVDWSDKFMIIINLPGNYATFDFDELTRLVFLAHWYAIRVEIEPCNFRYLKLRFSQRIREGSMSRRHPTLDQAMETFKQQMQSDGIDEMTGINDHP